MKVLCIAIGILVALCAQSQDLIVTNEGDSLNCTITKVEKENLLFRFTYRDEERYTLLPKSEIGKFKYNYFRPSDKSKNTASRLINDYRLLVNAGTSKRTSDISVNKIDGYTDYFQKLSTGYCVGGDIQLFFSNYLGIGLKSSAHLSSNSIRRIVISNENESSVSGPLENNILILFLGPSLNSRLYYNNRKNALHFGLGLGQTYFTDKSIVVERKTATGKSIGTFAEIGVEMKLSNSFGLGFQVTGFWGKIDELNIADSYKTETLTLNKNNAEPLNRIDFSIFLRFSN